MSRAVLVTRHPADCGRLAELLRPADISVRPFPVLRLEEVDDEGGWKAVRSLVEDGSPAWIALTSPRAPERLVRGVRHRDLEAVLGWPIAVVGEGTAEAAVQAGLSPELVGPGSGAGLAEILIPLLQPGAPLVLACGVDRRPELPDAIAAAGHPVRLLVLYAMRRTPERELPPLGPGLAAVIVTSPRAARFYLEAVGGRPLPLPHFALGPTTRDAAAALGIDCRIPPQPTIESLAEELCRI